MRVKLDLIPTLLFALGAILTNGCRVGDPALSRPPSERVKRENYELLRLGMTYAEAETILGKPSLRYPYGLSPLLKSKAEEYLYWRPQNVRDDDEGIETVFDFSQPEGRLVTKTAKLRE